MSFFAGRIGTKTVLSLNKASGGDVNIHNTPNTNSIFHSDMPHLFVKKRYVTNLSHAGNGYYHGAMPSDLPTVLANRANVVVPVLVVKGTDNVEYYHQMTGIQKSGSYRWNSDMVGISAQFTGALHFDLNLEWGYYQNAAGINMWERLGNNGTGGQICYWGEWGEDFLADLYFMMKMGFNPTNESTKRKRGSNINWTPRSNPSLPVEMYENVNLINPDYMYPLGPSSSTYSHVWVRKSGSRLANGFFNLTQAWMNGRGTNCKLRDIDFDDNMPGSYSSGWGNEYITGSVERLKANGTMPSFLEYTFDVTPVRIEHLLLNVTFNNTGGYTAQNLFTGSEIIIGRDKFVIKGHDLRNTQYEMLSTASTGVPTISNTYFFSNCVVGSATALPDGGSFRLYGTNKSGGVRAWNASRSADGVGNSTPWNIGLYKFPASSSIAINSSNNTVSINGVTIWGPTVRPLQLFTANKANNVTIGDNTQMIAIATGGTRLLNTVNVGLTSEPSTVLISIEWMGNNLCDFNGDPSLQWIGVNAAGGASTDAAGIGKRLTKMDYDKGDGVCHQIMVLPLNQFVPVLADNVFSYAGASNPADGKPKSRFQYYLRRISSGAVEFWGTSRATVVTGAGKSATPYIQFPKLRLNIQRLT